MDLFDIAAKIRLDSSEFEKGLENANEKGENFSRKLKTGLKTGAAIGGSAVTALGSGVVALGKNFVDGVTDVSAYGDAIDKNSQKMGISAEAYQEWDFVLQHSGSSIDAMGRGMMTLSKQAESNSDAFEKLGITQEDLATLNKEDLFEKTIEGLQALGEGVERDALAAELFGGSAKELGPLLNTSADEVEAMRKQVHNLGGIMSDDAVKAAAGFQDSLQNLKTTVSGIKRSFLSDFLPSVSKVSDGLTKLFSGDKENGLKDIQDGIDELINNLTDKLPEFLEIGFSIVESLAQAIADNLPTLIEKGADLILNGILPGIIDNIPQLVETAFVIISQLAIALGQALPELIPAAVDMILQIVESLLDNIDLLIDAALAIIVGLAEGLIASIPKLIEKAPEIVAKLVNAIIRNAGKLLNAADELIKSLVKGIADAFTTLVKKGKEIVEKIGSGMTEMWDKVKSWGHDVITKIGKGISDTWEKAKEWGSGVISKIGKGISDAWEKVKEFGKNIVSKIGSGITSTWEKFTGWAGNIITKIWNGLISGLDKIKEVGKYIIEGIWNGIKSAAGWLWNQITGWAGGLVDGIKDLFGISSPSKVFANEIGKWIPLGMEAGFDKQMPGVKRRMQASLDDLVTGVSAEMNVNTGTGGIMSPVSKPVYIVLDTGELVGKTVEKYDAALGAENAMMLRWEGAV